MQLSALLDDVEEHITVLGSVAGGAASRNALNFRNMMHANSHTDARWWQIHNNLAVFWLWGSEVS